MLQAKTHFEQVPIEAVRKILDGQNRQEEAKRKAKEGRKEDLLETKEEPLAGSRSFSPEVEKQS
jgi:hypothetical protein